MAMLHIVDDERYIRELLADIANLVGFGSKLFCSASGYLAYLESNDYNPPRALITDINMPGMIGCTICYPLKEKCPDIKVIVMSGNLEQCSTRCCKSHRAYGLIDHKLQKPFMMGELVKFLESVR